MSLKRKDHFTYVVTYTFSTEHKAIADAFRAYLMAQQPDGLAAIDLDQSTYGTKIEMDTLELLKKLLRKLNELYRLNEMKKTKDDMVNLLCNPNRAFKVDTIRHPSDVYQFDVFDFEK